MWKTDDPLAPRSRIFVHENDLDDVRLALDGMPVPVGLEVIEVTARAAEHFAVAHAIAHADEFDKLAKQSTLDRRAAAALIGRFDPALSEALTAAIEFLHAVWLKDATATPRLAETLRSVLSNTKAIPSPSRNWGSRLARYLALVVDGATRIWSWPTIYEHSKPQMKYRSWWNFAPTLPARWAAVSAEYMTVVTLAAPPDIAAVRQWVDDFQVAASRLKLHGQASEADCFFCASAYFMTLAEHFSVRREPILVLLALHRAAEWLMVARLAQSHALTYTHGIQMKQGSLAISFQVALTDCLLKGIVTAPENAVLQTLNDWRNLLMYTHHMSSPPESMVGGLLSDLGPIMRRVGAKDWQQHYIPLSAEMPVDFALILDPGNHLRSGMRVVPYTELAI